MPRDTEPSLFHRTSTIAKSFGVKVQLQKKLKKVIIEAVSEVETSLQVESRDEVIIEEEASDVVSEKLETRPTQNTIMKELSVIASVVEKDPSAKHESCSSPLRRFNIG